MKTTRLVIRTILGAVFCFLLPLSLPGHAERLSLNGTWQFSYSPASSDTPLKWESLQVPSYQQSRFLKGQPYGFYRRTFSLPAMRKRVFLVCAGIRYRAQIFLNGNKIAESWDGWGVIRSDITSAVKRTGENELLIIAGDWSTLADGKVVIRELTSWEADVLDMAKSMLLAPAGYPCDRLGIWQDVFLEDSNDQVVETVLVSPSVRQKQLNVSVQVSNFAAESCNLEIQGTVYDGKSITLALPLKKVTIAPLSDAEIPLSCAWRNPILWTPGNPHLYYLETKVLRNNEVLAEQTTRFGFREFSVDGQYGYLNGTRIKLRGTSICGAEERDEQEIRAIYREAKNRHCTIIRLHMHPAPQKWYDLADEEGMLLIGESALYCRVEAYKLSSPVFWENARRHVTGMVRNHYNNPSVVIWSIENEFLLCGGQKQDPRTTEELIAVGRAVKSIDPTRPIMFEGDGDPGGSADIINLHYPHESPRWNLFPETSYWLERRVPLDTGPAGPWAWDRKKPLYIGEFMWMYGRTPDTYSVFMGDAAYTKNVTAGNPWEDEEKAECWKRQIQAYRDAEVLGMCPWLAPLPGQPGDLLCDAERQSYQPVSVFLREEYARFRSGKTGSYHYTLHNDLPEESNLELVWELQGEGGRVYDRGRMEARLAPAGISRGVLQFSLPEVQTRRSCVLTLTVKRNGVSVSSLARNITVFPSSPPTLHGDIVLCAGEGRLRQYLLNSGVRVQNIADPGTVSHLSSGILIIGKNSLPGIPALGASSTGLLDFVKSGGKLVIMEQEDTAGMAHLLGVRLGKGATICFPRVPDHPLLRGLQADDLRFWQPDHLVMKQSVLKPEDGPFQAIVDAGGEAGLTSCGLAEMRLGKGLIILCQLQMEEALGIEPAADEILANILNYCADFKPETQTLGIWNGTDAVRQILHEVGARSENLPPGTTANHDVILCCGGWRELPQSKTALLEFVGKGGVAWLHNPPAETLPALSPLLPKAVVPKTDLSLPVNLHGNDRLTRGLSDCDLYWTGKESGRPTEVLSPVNISSYSVWPSFTDRGAPTVLEAASLEITQGAVKQNNEVLCYAASSATGEMETTAGYHLFGITGRGTPCYGEYPRVEIMIDGKACGGFTVQAQSRRYQGTPIYLKAGKHTMRAAFANDAYNPPMEDRNLWIANLYLQPVAYDENGVLTVPCVLLKIVSGKGFFLIDTVNWEKEARNAEKARRFLTALLNNLGIPFDKNPGWILPLEEMRVNAKIPPNRIANGVVYLATNGSLEQEIELVSDGDYRFAVKMRGSLAQGEGPHAAFFVDGRKVGETDIGERLQSYEFTTGLTKGKHIIAIAFTNDLYKPPEDRNLEIWGVTVYLDRALLTSGAKSLSLTVSALSVADLVAGSPVALER